MLDLFVTYDRLQIPIVPEIKSEEDRIASTILNSFDNLWLENPTEVDHTLITDDTCNQIGIDLIRFNRAIGSDWYDLRRISILSRLTQGFSNGDLITNSLEHKLIKILMTAYMLDGLPAYLDGTEIDNYALVTAIMNLNSHVVSNPNLQSYHQFQGYAGKLLSIMQSKSKTTKEEVVKWHDAIGVGVAMMILHALILLFNRHNEISTSLRINLISALKIV